MNRRKFFKVSGAGLALVAGGSLLTKMSGFDRSDLEEEKNELYPLPKDINEIFNLASLAPSGHNTQPWLVRIMNNNTFRIKLNKNCLLPAVDPKNRESILSIGAFSENFVVAANNYGYATELEVLTDDPFGEDILEIRLNKDRAVPYQLSRIKTRRTVRNGYNTRGIDSEDFAFITNKDTSHFHYFPAESKEGKFLSQGTIEANRIQVYRDDAQNELADWIRWSPEEAKTKRDGLTPESMEIEGFAGWFVRNFYTRESALEPSFREKSVEKVIDQVKSSGGWTVITSKDMSVKSLVETGRLFERMFLKPRERMIGIHPMTQLLEETQFNKVVAGELGLNTNEIQFILRTGYLERYPDPVSLRRSARKIILNMA